MKLIKNILGLGYIAYTLMTIRKYKIKIERLHREGRHEEERAAIAEVCHLWTDKLVRHFRTNIEVINPQNLPEKARWSTFLTINLMPIFWRCFM